MNHPHPPYVNVYRRADIVMERGQGVYLYDITGKAYLDCASGIAVNALGHGHPRVVEALKQQADALWHCSNNYRNAPLERFAVLLMQQSPLHQVFFCSSGAEAIDSSIKFMRRAQSLSRPERTEIISFENGFHGRALSCLSAGGNAAAREGYHPLLPGFHAAKINDIYSVKALVSERTAGILLEPIQGEGGVFPAEKGFLHALRALCNETGILLTFDEVQCGYGRAGQLFTHDVFGVVPDMVVCAKGIGNGFPLAAVLVNERIADCLTPGCHGSTYGSNPLAMAVGEAVLQVMLEDGFFEHVQVMGDALLAGLRALAVDYPSLVAEARGIGLMLGLQLRVDGRKMAAKLREAGLLVAPAYGDVLRYVPPLIINKAEINEALAITRRVFDAALIEKG